MMAAPRAHCDDEWQNFSEFKTGLEQGARINLTKLFADEATGMLENVPELDNSFSSKIGSFKSMEDLANGFDEKLTECFQNFNTKTHRTDPVDLINEDTIMRSDEIWNALTDNYGKVMAVDWKQSRTRSLHLPALTLEGRPRAPRCVRELLDDEELRDQMDMHSIIVSCLNDEPLLTAEQVIEEIEGMMLDSPEMETEQNPSQPDLTLDRHCFRTSLTFEQRVRTLCVAELNELLEEVETAIRRDSELLIQHLALRDELDFEKEVKNSFISVLIDVQNRQKEHREALRKKRRPKGGAGTPQGRSERPAGSFFSMEGLSSAIQNGFRQTFGSGASERQYLTTVIPYEEKGGPPSVQDLQILTNILQAMRDDSDKVPSLLTDYILKVLCPT